MIRASIACSFVLLGPALAVAQLNRPLDPLEPVGVDEKVGDYLPLATKFRDSRGSVRELGDWFDGERPVILSLNYSSCPMLCQLQLNGLFDGMRELEWTAGEEFRLVSVSVDPRESPDKAAETRQRYLRVYRRTVENDAVNFLVGDKLSIDKVADATGFRFAYIPERDEYAHAAVIMVCTADGKVSRYLYGVQYPADTLKKALVEAGEGRVGSTLDRLLLFCFHYDAESGTYAPAARTIMKFAGGATVAVICALLLPAWLRRRAEKRPRTTGAPA